VSAVVPAPVRAILERGAFCHVGARTPAGPHVTPMVFAAAGGAVWVTTSRGSVKARAWRADPRVAGSVRDGDRAVAFAGAVTTYDLLEPESWGRSLSHGPPLALAGARFTSKNARFFAGYAVDAHQVPFAWMPPGRVFAEIHIERSAVLEAGRVASAWGEWGDALEGVERFRAARAGDPVLSSVPGQPLGSEGVGALGLETAGGPVVLPVGWAAEGGGLYAVLPGETLALAEAKGTPRVALAIDRPSTWRAREMVGAMVRGEGEIAVASRLATGARSAARIARLAGLEDAGAAIVRVRPASVVWWHGWTSGTVSLG
jgi:nitroimidazol reductase NimA-like FMN-containing flavoprotein (pyridoxamine 5'-phosphate oxidase superfamily)